MMNFKTDFYERLFKSLDNNAVLMRIEDDGMFHPVWCSHDFALMMETTEDKIVDASAEGTLRTTHPDDRDDVAYLFKNHKTKDGTNSLTIRKYTLEGNLIWVNVHYAFVKEDEVQYVYCTYTDVTGIKESQAQAERMYESTVADLEALSHGALTFLRVDLTTDVMEDIRGSDVFAFNPEPGADHLAEWNQFFPLESDQKRFGEKFSAPALIEAYNNGITYLTDIFYTRRQSGRKCFVKVTENIRKEPRTGDIVSFFTEYDYTEDMVNQVVENKALVELYDMITYIIDGEYGVVIGDAKHTQKGAIFPKTKNGDYSRYIEEQVVPVLSGTEDEKAEMADMLKLETVSAVLDKKDTYEANIVCEIDGDIFHKRFVFYVVNHEAKFYVLLKSDVTDVIKEQQERNELLSNALNEAEKANAAKTAFLSSMSHEIRTPMNAIIGLDSLALSEPDISETTRDYLEKIGSSAQHLMELINDILDMNRIESGRLTLKNEEFSFSEMLQQINTIINGQCEDKSLKYDCRIHGNIDDYYIGDDMKLKQVLINILGNAVKFTPEKGRVSLDVERIAQFEGKTTLRFIIKDSGIGMDESFIPRIFDAFAQEDENKVNKYGSTGLGMAITKSIVEMMNGSIKVDSKKGVGSTFTVTITLQNSDKIKGVHTVNVSPSDLCVPVADDDRAAGDHAKKGLKGRHILVAEDILINAEIVKKMLKMKEMEVDHAENGQLVIDMFEKSDIGYYDAILMDVRMPVKTGLEATAEIRSLDREDAAKIPIIAMTANAFDEDVQNSLQAGMNAHLSKPVVPATLFETLQNLIKD